MRRRTLKKCLTELARDRKKVCVCLAAVSALVFGLLLPGRIVVAISPSLDHRIFVITGFTPDRIGKEDYVIFTVRSHYIKDGKPSRLLKKASCVAGQRLETRARRVLLRRRVPGHGEAVFPGRGARRCLCLFGHGARGKALRHGQQRRQLRFEVPRLHRKEKR